MLFDLEKEVLKPECRSFKTSEEAEKYIENNFKDRKLVFLVRGKDLAIRNGDLKPMECK